MQGARFPGFNYAFAWNVNGRHRVVTNGVHDSAYSPANGAPCIQRASTAWNDVPRAIGQSPITTAGYSPSEGAVRLTQSVRPCMVLPLVVRYSSTRSNRRDVHSYTPNIKTDGHHGFPSNHTPNTVDWYGTHRPFRRGYQRVRLCT